MQQPPESPIFAMGVSSQQLINSQQENNKKDLPSFSYTSKIKTAVYGFILFIVLSNKISYKIVNLIFSLFTNRQEIINEYDEPMPLGILINAFILAFILFIF